MLCHSQSEFRERVKTFPHWSSDVLHGLVRAERRGGDRSEGVRYSRSYSGCSRNCCLPDFLRD